MDKKGRYRLKYKDDESNQVYRIDAPNNVFFNDDLTISKGAYIHKSRKL